MHTIKVGASPARPERSGRAFGERHADEASTAGSGAGSALQQISEGAIDAERHIAARFVFEIIAGEAAGEGQFDGAQVCSHESSAAAGVIFLIAERAAFEPERETRSEAPPDARKAPILLKRRAIGRVGRDEPQRRDVEPALRHKLEANGAPLHRVVWIARVDALILCLDSSEQLDDQSVSAELITEKRRAIACIAIEGGAEIAAPAKQRAAIVVAAKAANGARQPGA